jgi:hypothetical protein
LKQQFTNEPARVDAYAVCTRMRDQRSSGALCVIGATTLQGITKRARRQ